MEDNLNKKLKDKGYACDCECKVHQIKKLGIKEINIPNLNGKKRIGVIKRLTVKNKKIEDKKIKPAEKVETESITFKKFAYWYEILGKWGELVVILEKSEKTINNLEEIEKNLDIIKFFQVEDEELNEYRKKVILLGIKSLFERGEVSYWDKIVYILLNTSSTGKSAGVSLLICFYSAYYGTGIPNNFSATGKININDGSIEGIVGLKEKFLCAIIDKGIDNLVLPRENYEEVLKISNAYSKRFTNISKKLKFYPVSHWRDLINLLSQWEVN